MRITARKHGVNEGTTKSDAALAVQSIPAYVEVGPWDLTRVRFPPQMVVV